MHKAALDRVIDRQAMVPLRREFNAGVGTVHRALLRVGHSKRPATPADAARIAHHAQAQVARAFRGVVGSLSDSTRTSVTEGVRSLGAYYSHFSGRASSALDDPRVVQRVVTKQTTRLQVLRADHAADVAADVAQSVRAEVLAASRAPMSVAGLVEQAAGTMDEQWWKLERLARTESAIAFNAGSEDAIDELAEQHTDLMKRWTEMVSDGTGEPFDARVGKDSLVLHGQVAFPGDLFTMPNDPRLVKSLRLMVGKSWAHPPNRPNDRAVLLPWARDWGIPGWVVKGGRRSMLT